MNKNFALIVVVVLVCSFLLTGCGKTDDMTLADLGNKAQAVAPVVQRVDTSIVADSKEKEEVRNGVFGVLNAMLHANDANVNGDNK